MEIVTNYLNEKINIMKAKGINVDALNEDVLDSLYSAYPFNKFEYIFSHLISHNIITLQEYLEIRNAYLDRNKYLYVFEITAPRTFGETWAEGHLNEVVPDLRCPNTNLDPNYSGQYDFWYEGIKIEVKASRAVKRKSGSTLIQKALSCDSQDKFNMNFQQIKPDCCDVFVWIAVWRDAIRYWVLSSKEVENNKYYSFKQHRGNTGEGQLWLKHNNIKEFDTFQVNEREIKDHILLKGCVEKNNTYREGK